MLGEEKHSNKHVPVCVEEVNLLWLNLWCVAARRFGLHGFSTLRDETLPPGGREASKLDEESKQVRTKAVFNFCALRTYFL